MNVRFPRSLLALLGVGCLVACKTPDVTYDDEAPDFCRNDVLDALKETDVDCGGDCPPCANGRACAGPSDCRIESCIDGICQLGHCLDGEKSGDESDVDCGGACAACPDGYVCASDADCASGNCDDVTSQCVPGDCDDQDRNGDETDVDCGGPDCDPCPAGLACEEGPDCASGLCVSGTCEDVSCSDGRVNGDETDVDCGGGSCDSCSLLQRCLDDADCASEVCRVGLCVDPACTNATLDGTETDVDCGGDACAPCEPGQDCAVAADCTSRICDDGECTAPDCEDSVKNGDETDEDCGGTCPPCADELRCGIAADCESGVCTAGVCASPSCDDEAENQDETDVDCGGDTCDPCGVGRQCSTGDDCASGYCGGGECISVECSDGALNGGETGVDCGGRYCPGCPAGEPCLSGDDCMSRVCDDDGQCAAATCEDAVKNGDETDRDCGGGTCNPCAVGDRCAVGTDCVEAVCAANGTCSAPTCRDEAANGSETDQDCGGPSCGPCPDRSRCIEHSDCESGRCVNGRCAVPSCTDLVTNGDETDRDCGGSCETKCQNLQSCERGRDCISDYCDPVINLCAAAECSDEVKNGDETDLNCGGPDCPACSVGQVCLADRDCSTRNCGEADEETGVRRCEDADCDNGKTDGSETDEDCGGSCEPCGTEARCGDAEDCISRVCSTSGDSYVLTCQAASCSDRVQNQGETGIDCGIAACGGCGAGIPCTADGQCASGICDDTGATRVCTAALCTDDVRNGDESGVDCGGSCDPCPDGEPCNSDADCTSRSCGTDDRCAAAACDDERQNGNETGPDCGGPDCRATSKCPNNVGCAVDSDCQSGYCDGTVCADPGCTDRTLNGHETDLDCGGEDCRVSYPCADGKQCVIAADCRSGVCDDTECLAPTCSDGVLNGEETDKDCGGAACRALATPKLCADSKHCDEGADCQSGVCGGDGTCTPPSCSDGVLNGLETGTDCGGSLCRSQGKLCDEGLPCQIDGDCNSLICNPYDICTEPSCEDGKQNQGETAIDCGGPICTGLGYTCDDGLACEDSVDCTNGYCRPDVRLCSTPTCSDGYRNLTETDVDCGGGCVASANKKCANGRHCSVSNDCTSSYCNPTTVCSTPSCTDAWKNNLETDLNCGGPNCRASYPCAVGATCAIAEDCVDPAHASGTCPPATLACSYTCDSGYLDCTSAAGCESSASSLSTCGSCTNVCGTAGTTAAVCTSGSCVLTCDATHGDCNSSRADGCETSISSSETNCGACGAQCLKASGSLCQGTVCCPRLGEYHDQESNGGLAMPSAAVGSCFRISPLYCNWRLALQNQSSVSDISLRIERDTGGSALNITLPKNSQTVRIEASDLTGAFTAYVTNNYGDATGRNINWWQEYVSGTSVECACDLAHSSSCTSY
ncbi:MAG: hypothetical protein JW751_01715 [Polyangiaceae bacterium]|nr:hypothetical protein [Polyangiaceae bacterium]